MTHTFSIEVLAGERLTIAPQVFVVAGYTGRDEAAVHEHIEELAAIGIAPPALVPMLYELEPHLLSTERTVAASDSLVTGEIEPVFIRHDGRWYLGVGSDLTDRDLERDDVKTSKAACPKPMGTTVLLLPDDVAEGGFDTTWDQIAANSYVDGDLYQQGSLASIRPPSDLIPRINELSEVRDSAAQDLVIFAGTIPVVGGTFRDGSSWKGTLSLPDGRKLNHEHDFLRMA